MPSPDLDSWLPSHHIRSRHCRTAAASEADVWAAASSIRLGDTRTLGRLVAWRIPGLKQSSTYRELFTSAPFTLLHETDSSTVSGLAGRIWTLRRDYPSLAGADEFRAWDEPRTVRVLFAHWTEPHPSGGTTLFSEARVEAVDAVAKVRLKVLWTAVGPFERLIGAEPLELAAARAEG